MRARQAGFIFALALCPALPVQLAAQDADPDIGHSEAITAEEAMLQADEMWRLEAGHQEEADPCDQPDDPDVILVCRQTVDPERYMFEREPEVIVSADVRTTAGGAPRPPDFNDSCLNTRGRENCNMGGWVPPPAIMVDFDELPETPAGSDAARLYGGPTSADESSSTNSGRTQASNENGGVIGSETEAAPDPEVETQIGLNDDVYGP